MAGIKITDLTALTTSAAGDYLCIVDVSDTTQSPEGTTKKIEVSNIIPSAPPTVNSGTWTPTFGDFTGCVVGVTAINAYYTRIGNIVTATIEASADLDFSISSFGYCDCDVPVATSLGERIGLGQLLINSTNCNIASNTSKIYFYSTSSSDIGTAGFTFTFQYEVN